MLLCCHINFENDISDDFMQLKINEKIAFILKHSQKQKKKTKKQKQKPIRKTSRKTQIFQLPCS